MQVYSFIISQFLIHFNIKGEGNGQFNAPTGVAVDSQDNILVADWGNSRSGLRKTATISLNVNFMAFSFYPVKILTITPTLFAGSKSIVTTIKTVLMSLVTQDPGV